ncbi:MAG: DUF4340 domain-containing protein [Alphaproteobacteria bacterium]|nr:DUF4340 domain-containing protein [Alphaproteobacteria bacterium]
MSTQTLLGGALAVQVALAVVTWWPSGPTVVEPTDLVPGGADSITQITVTPKGGTSDPVQLVQKDGAWTLASADGYPADADKVAEVVDALGTIKLRTPIATRAVTHEQLGVSDDSYEKKVEFTAGGTEHTLLLGAAANKAIHLRVDGGDAVYQVKGLSAWTIKDTNRGYLPSDYVDVDKDTLSSLAITTPLGAAAFTRTGTGWAVDGHPELVGDAAALDTWLGKIAKVRLSDVAGTTAEPAFGLTPAAVRITWSGAQGDQQVTGGLAVGAEADGRIYVKSDDSPFIVQAPSYGLKDLATLDPATLVAPAPTDAGGAEGEPLPE